MLLACASMLFLPSRVLSQAEEMPQTASELVSSASFISIVEIKNVSPLRYEEASLSDWIYPQSANAIVKSDIVGRMPGQLLLKSYSGSQYRGQSVLKPGTYLAFMVPSGGHYYELSSPCSLRVVRDGTVFWFDGYIPLPDAIGKIQSLWASRPGNRRAHLDLN